MIRHEVEVSYNTSTGRHVGASGHATKPCSQLAGACVQATVWIVVGVMLYGTIITASILHVYNMVQAEALQFEAGEYFPTHRLGYAVTVERGLWAMASIVVWFRLLKCGATPLLGCYCYFRAYTAECHMLCGGGVYNT